MAKSIEKYEVLYVLNPNLTEEETQAVVEKFKTLIEQNGTIDEMEEWGKRKLAYEINYLTEGYYVLVKFTSGPEFPAELDRVLGITDGVIRINGLPYHRIIPRHVDDLGGLIAEYDAYGTQILEQVT